MSDPWEDYAVADAGPWADYQGVSGSESRSAAGWQKILPSIAKALDYTGGLTRSALFSARDPGSKGQVQEIDREAEKAISGLQREMRAKALVGESPSYRETFARAGVPLAGATGTIADIATDLPYFGWATKALAPTNSISKWSTRPLSEAAKARGNVIYDSAVKNINKALVYDKGAAPLTEILTAEGRPAFTAGQLPPLLDQLAEKNMGRQKAIYQTIKEKGPRKAMDISEEATVIPAAQHGLPLSSKRTSPYPLPDQPISTQPYVPMQQTSVIPEQPSFWMPTGRVDSIPATPKDMPIINMTEIPGRSEMPLGREVWYPELGNQMPLPLNQTKRTPVDMSVAMPPTTQIQPALPLVSGSGTVDISQARKLGDNYIKDLSRVHNLKSGDPTIERLRAALEQYTEQANIDPFLAGERKTAIQKAGREAYRRGVTDAAAGPTAELMAKIGTGYKNALESAAERSSPGLGKELEDVNRRLQTLMYAETPAAQQVKREITKNLVTAVDAPLFYFNPVAGMAKKAAEWSAMTGPRTYGGKGLSLLGNSLLPDAAARQTGAWYLRDRGSE